MSQLVVTGNTKLIGEIRASGSKNSVLPILAATVMIEEPVVIKNVPELKDVETMISILQQIGKVVTFKDETVTVKPGEVLIGSVPYELVRKMRASFNVIGPLAMICGWARVGKPGGCNIGQRPVDFHLKGLEAFGFKISEEHGDVLAMTPSEFKKEIIYTLPFPSVGATEQLMTTASLMSGTQVIIENAAREPEITDLQGFLNSCGARVSGASTPTIEVYGVSNLHGCDYSVIPDRIEAGTYLLGALTTKGDITIKGARYDHIISLISVLEEMGAGVEKGNDFVRGFWKGPLKPVTVSSEPYPGFPTDLQPLLTSVLATVEGTSILEENVFENRFGYVDELNRMGAKIKVSSRQAFIVGVHRLSGAEVVAPDIRAGAALVMAGLAADGETIINNVTHIFRGYERFQEKLSRLGAKIAYYDDR
ncbi:MAG TPA: UDP-N-acetylglucosamine 1-carboxyvinyltransferase [Mesotoga infera]|nr:UDP-N-acetylglucosamine 1-carboxyvinyltransferase [Mesotoga infera]